MNFDKVKTIKERKEKKKSKERNKGIGVVDSCKYLLIYIAHFVWLRWLFLVYIIYYQFTIRFLFNGIYKSYDEEKK